jgi:hypothetical protein
LKYAVSGGTTEEGITVAPIPLIANARISEYYATYALTLARLNRCAEALPVIQDIQNRIPGDATAVFNAQEATRICQQNLPAASPTPEQETP